MEFTVNIAFESHVNYCITKGHKYMLHVFSSDTIADCTFGIA